MNLDNALELKQKILSEQMGIDAFTNIGDNVTTQAITSIPKPDSRLAVGLSQTKRDNYLLELRVQRNSGSAYKKAEEWKHKVSGEARILVVEKIQVPPFTQIQNETGNSFRPRWTIPQLFLSSLSCFK